MGRGRVLQKPRSPPGRNEFTHKSIVRQRSFAERLAGPGGFRRVERPALRYRARRDWCVVLALEEREQFLRGRRVQNSITRSGKRRAYNSGVRDGVLRARSEALEPFLRVDGVELEAVRSEAGENVRPGNGPGLNDCVKNVSEGAVEGTEDRGGLVAHCARSAKSVGQVAEGQRAQGLWRRQNQPEAKRRSGRAFMNIG